MQIVENSVGSFVRGGQRFAIYADDGEEFDVRPAAAAAGYTFDPLPPAMTAQKWIEREGYSALMAVALLDLERKATAAGATSPKLVAVRGWFDSMLAGYAADPSPRRGWPAAPHTFAEVAADVAAAVGG